MEVNPPSKCHGCDQAIASANVGSVHRVSGTIAELGQRDLPQLRPPPRSNAPTKSMQAASYDEPISLATKHYTHPYVPRNSFAVFEGRIKLPRLRSRTSQIQESTWTWSSSYTAKFSPQTWSLQVCNDRRS